MPGYRPLIPQKVIPDEIHQAEAESRDTLVTFTNVDFQRARFWCLTGAVALEVPRRLGPDANDYELVIDKRVCRKVCYNYRELWRMFHRYMQTPEAPGWREKHLVAKDPLMTRIGSTVIWEYQIDYLRGIVKRRTDELAAHEELARTSGMRKWHYKQKLILDWELDALQRIANFMDEKRLAI